MTGFAGSPRLLTERTHRMFTKLVPFAICLLMAGLVGCGGGSGSQSSSPAPQLGYEKITLHSPFVGDTLVIDVSLPPGYASEPNRIYPVLYITDAYWRRGDYESLRALMSKKITDPFIIVGIGYPDTYDFNTVRVRDLVDKQENFLASIKTEVMPMVEARYRMDPSHRVLWGASYGGFFCLYAFGQHEAMGRMFSGYLCVSSPYMKMNVLTDLRTTSPDFPCFFYLAVGDLEVDTMTSVFNRLDTFFKEPGFTQLIFQSHRFLGKDHYTVAVPALLEGATLAFPRS